MQNQSGTSQPKGFSFEECLEFVFEAEGGYSNDAHDLGGETQYGITHEEYYSWLKRKGKEKKNISQITKEEASLIYREDYWEKFGCHNTPAPLNLVLFDTAIQHGKARQLYKQALDESPKFNSSPSNVARALIEVRREYYHSLVRKNSTQGKFLKGWMNRLDNLKKRAGL